MPRLVLVISDLYPARAQQPLPRLAQLEQWLARGERLPTVTGWQQWLLEEFFGERYAQQSWAQIAAAALLATGTEDTGLNTANPWLATPVHLVAGLDTVRVHPAGLLTLTGAEQQELVRDFAAVFQGSGWTLHATGQRELLMQADRALQARSSDPARWLGSDPAQGMIAGPDAAPLRRLGAELEMWLHEHPVNRARSARAQLPVSGLWLWGGTAAARPAAGGKNAPRAAMDSPAPGQPDMALRVYGADLFLAGLCASSGSGRAALELPWPAVRSSLNAPGDAIVHCPLGPGADSARLQALDHDLIAPLLLQLRAGLWDSLTLLAADQAVNLRRNGWRVWKALTRSEPWWERLLG